MKFLTTAETARKWGVSASLVLKLAKGGRIPGTVQIGTRWMIPDNAEKPADARTQSGRSSKKNSFRYPGYEYRTISSFSPPLNEEELVIKAATEVAYACRFKEAESLLGNLANTTDDKYLRINALYTGCMIDIYRGHASRFLEHYSRLAAELETDFAHKIEMKEFIYSIDATLGSDTYYGRDFRVLPDYEYHESFLPRLANLSAVSLTIAGAKPTASELRAHELSCIFLKDSEAYADLVSLHLYLGIAYCELGDVEKQSCHLRTALSLAEKFEIYYCVAYHYFYMEKLLKPVLAEFSEGFRLRIEKLSRSMHRTLTRFINEISINNLYGLLHHGDYIFLYYAVHGLSNKETADRLNMSVGAVGKRYGDIYALLGVENKAELVQLYEKSLIDA